MIRVCLKYNASFINVISLILSIIIVTSFSFGVTFIQGKIHFNHNENILKNYKDESNIVIETNTISKEKKENIVEKEENEFDWYIEIPKIKLYAPIEEGTEDEILNRSVGHFESTSRRNGNCGLAAHNRGYRVNYFANVKELEKGDIIYYFVDGKKYKYEVDSIIIIYETDWSMLEETEDDRITLITCVENRSEYRLCVQGILIQE